MTARTTVHLQAVDGGACGHENLVRMNRENGRKNKGSIVARRGLFGGKNGRRTHLALMTGGSVFDTCVNINRSKSD